MMSELEFVAMNKRADISAAKDLLERRIKELEDCQQSDEDPEARAMIAMDELFVATLDFLAGEVKLAVPSVAKYMPGDASAFGRRVLNML